MNIHIQVFNKFSQIQTQVELLLYMLTVCLTIYRTVFQSGCIIVYSHQPYMKVPISLHLHQCLLLSVFCCCCCHPGSLLLCAAFSLWWIILLQSTGLQFAGSRALVQQLWCMGLIALWHVESSWTRFQTHIPCNGRRILNHWTTRKTLLSVFLITTIQWVCLMMNIFFHVHSGLRYSFFEDMSIQIFDSFFDWAVYC